MSIKNPGQNILIELFAERHDCHGNCYDDYAVGVDNPSAESVCQVAEQWRYQYLHNDVAANYKTVFHILNHIFSVVQCKVLFEQHRL